jgi:hypothetical protein
MNIIPFVFSTTKLNLSLYIFTILLGFSLISLESNDVFGIELFSKNEQPFGISYDEWISKYWNWWVGKSIEEATPVQGGCIIDKSDSIVMLMETTVGGSHNQECEISSNQGILIPLWIAWCDSGTDKEYPIEELSQCAREKYNLGNIKSEVKIDGQPLAKLDVRLSLMEGTLDYKINSLSNVSEIYVKAFNLTAPADTHKAFTLPGTYHAGAHGWFIFLKPLPAGDHTVFYNVRVTPTGALTSPGTTANFADITYLFHVK